MANTPYLRWIHRLLPIAVLAVIAGCTPLDRLRHAQDNAPGGFHADLSAEYLSFAESEKELERDKSSRFFAEKGLRAAHDESTRPEIPADWHVDADTTLELVNARERLMRVRSEFFERVASQTLARAQVMYDCWVMQASERTDNDLTLPCHGEFLGELGELEQIVNTLGPAPKVTLPAHYTILFPLGSATLGKDAEYTVQEVLAITRLYPLYTIDITGHADRSGSRERNMVLSTERAANVASALVDAGISAAHVGFHAEGEENPVIPTLDGIRRDRNRRVEIAVLPLLAVPGGEGKIPANTEPADAG